MSLALNGEHVELAQAVRGWAARNCPRETIRAAADSPGPAPADPARYAAVLAPSLAAQGLLGLHLPEDCGGQGYGLPELAIAVEELGRALVPGGFLPTVLASALLAAAGAPADGGGKLLAGLADGSRSAAVALATGLTARPGPDGGFTVTGTTTPVAGAALADLLILPAQAPGGEIWAAVDATDVEITPAGSLDLSRPAAEVRAAGLAVTAGRVLAVPAGRVLAGLTRDHVTHLAAVLFAAEAAGLAGWATATAAEHARARHQFGRPIGQFQAVKHRCARMLALSEEAAAAAWGAARAWEAGPAATGTEEAGAEREFAAAAAAVVAIDAATACTHDCIQVLGGMGYTWEHDAHLYYRRALSLRALLGSSDRWARRAARLALDGARRAAAVDLPAGAEPLRAEIRAAVADVAQQPAADRAAALAAGGWVMPHLPQPWGRGARPLEQLVIAEELKRARLRPPALLIGAWVVPALAGHGSAAQQERFLPPTLRGEITWCQLFSEPGAGSDLAGLTTRAERADGGWRLTGQKIWTSLAKEADWAICVARTDPASRRHAGISYFLVDMRSPGVTVRPLREMTGDALFNEVFLDGVLVPDDLVVGEVGHGWRVARSTLANERVSLSASWTFGCGTDELLEALRGLGEETRRDRLGEAGRLVSEGHAIDLLGLRVTLKQLSGTEPGATGSVRKLVGMRHAQEVAELCWSMQGAEGALTGNRPGGGPDWSRSVLLTRALTIGGGTTDIQLNIIGERILGLPRDPEPPEPAAG